MRWRLRCSACALRRSRELASAWRDRVSDSAWRRLREFSPTRDEEAFELAARRDEPFEAPAVFLEVFSLREELRERDDAFAVCESLRLVLRWFVF